MKDDCIFCKLANGIFPTNKVYEDELVTVILDAGPAAKGHALVMPKEHYVCAAEAPEALLGHALKIASKVGEAQKKVLGAEGYNILTNTGEASGQSVFHMHIHVIPRKTNDKVLGLWIPGEVGEEGKALAETLGKNM